MVAASSFRKVSARDLDNLRDESRRQGRAEFIAAPLDEKSLLRALGEAGANRWPVTVQGARTGITAGAVPEGGAILDLSGMNRVLDARVDGQAAEIRVQPGLRLSELREILVDPSRVPPGLEPAGSWRFAPDPTETSASLGGMAATNASGALSFSQGAMRAHVRAVRVALPGGDVLVLRRGEQKAVDSRFSLDTANGRLIEGMAPRYQLPPVKNAAGYYSRPDMDMLDLFVGCEGTLGIFTELTLALQPSPPICWGLLCFLPSEDAALSLVDRTRHPDSGCRPAALEYFDHDSLDMLREARARGLDLPPLAEAWKTALYVEYEGGEESEVMNKVEILAALLNQLGGSESDVWMATSQRELDPLKTFRHAVPEQVNLEIDRRKRRYPELTKLGTDLAVPDDHLRKMVDCYRRDLAAGGFQSVIFGHVGDNHLHVNILPRDMTEFRQGRELYKSWAETAIKWGGSVSAEHGIGKIKNALLAKMAGENGIAEMRRIKRLFDPQGLLNPGNIF